MRDVSRFEPGPIDDAAIEEIRETIGGGEDTICAIPDPNDRLWMHRIIPDLVMRTHGRANLLTYECLSTIEPSVPQMLFGFVEELMAVKCHAIRAHESMAERRRQFGGYSNPGTQGYDEIVRRRNAELARKRGLDFPYAERYGWLR